MKPTGDEEKPNEERLRFYESVLDELEKYHIQPLITIHHDELPLYLAETYDGRVAAEKTTSLPAGG